MRNKGEVVMTNEKVNCIDYIERAVRLRNSAYELLKFRGFFFFKITPIFKIFR